jgi:hypothetical protein
MNKKRFPAPELHFVQEIRDEHAKEIQTVLCKLRKGILHKAEMIREGHNTRVKIISHSRGWAPKILANSVHSGSRHEIALLEDPAASNTNYTTIPWCVFSDILTTSHVSFPPHGRTLILLDQTARTWTSPKIFDCWE